MGSWWLRRHPVVPYAPEYISIEVTNRCNFKCVFCPQSSTEHLATVGVSYLRAEQVRTLLLRIRAAGVTTDVLHWMLDGEPFMNRAFPELCAAAIEQGFIDFFFATNAVMATSQRLRQFPPDARYTLKIDYCSDAAQFESLRGTPGSWARIRDNIRGLIAASDLDHVHILITDMSSFAVRERRELRARYRDLKAMFAPNPRLTFATKTFHNATGFLPRRADARRSRYFVCPYPWATLHVASNGDVVACSRDLARKTVLGNLLLQPLQEIWNGEAMRSLRRDLAEQRPQAQAACAGCDMPYDASKFKLRNLVNTARGRLRLLD